LDTIKLDDINIKRTRIKKSRFLRISRSKTEYFSTDESQEGVLDTIKLDYINFKRTRIFKYLGSVFEEHAGMENELKRKIYKSVV
jgi:hypothetical protein